MAVSRSMIASPTLECGKRPWEDSSSLFVDSRVAFETLGDDLVANVFSFAIAPTSLPTLCACSQKCKGAAWQPRTWTNVLVDPSHLRPRATVARKYIDLWKNAFVINGPWIYEFDDIVLDSGRVWHFEHANENDTIFVSSPIPKPSICFLYKDIDWSNVVFGFALSNDLETIHFAVNYHIWKSEFALIRPPPPKPKTHACFVDIYVGGKKGIPESTSESGLAEIEIADRSISIHTRRAEYRRFTSEPLLFPIESQCYFIVARRSLLRSECDVRACWNFPSRS